MKKIFLIAGLISLISFNSCKNKEKKETESSSEKIESIIEKTEDSTEKIESSVKKVVPTVEKNITKNNEKPKIDKFTITETSVNGIQLGDAFLTHSDKFKRAKQENGEGTFKGYIIMDENAKDIGFAFPDTKEEANIGMIEITSSNYKTKEGIGVGSTFESVKKAYPNSETHGSEIESRTSVTVGNYSFLLNNTALNTYKVDESKIKPTTKIKRITIRK